MHKRLQTIVVSAFCFLTLGSILLPENAKSEEAGSWAKVIDNVRQTGNGDAGLSIGFCKAFALDGLINDGKDCPTKAKQIDYSTLRHVIDVATDTSGQTKVVIWHRTDTEATFYLTSADGDLENALYANKTSKSILPLSNEVRSDFEKEKAFWIQQLGGP